MASEKMKGIYKVTDTHVYGFFDKHRFLSNFHLTPVYFEGVVYPSNESAYQAAKSMDANTRVYFASMNPSQVKSAGRSIILRDDWLKELTNKDPEGLIVQTRDSIMYAINWDKYTRHPDLAEKLLETGDLILEETNWWKDDYWGVFEGKGLNKLGKILMRIRTKLKLKKEAA